MKILVTGATGMVGRNLVPELAQQKNTQVLVPTRNELNLLNQQAVESYLQTHMPDLIIHLAAKVGGIQANIAEPVQFLADNVSMNINVINAALKLRIPKLLNIGSSCMYPKNRDNLHETDLLTGALEPTNEGYALAKIMSVKLCEYITKQHGLAYKSIIPTNLYGPYDNFDIVRSHLIPAMITKIYQAKHSGAEVVIWGNGEARREFMHVKDLVDFILLAVNKIIELPYYINVGLGYDYSINEYYQVAAKVIGYTGRFTHDFSKPAGMRRKLLDVKHASKLGWCAKISLEDGLQDTYQYFLSINKDSKSEHHERIQAGE